MGRASLEEEDVFEEAREETMVDDVRSRAPGSS
jgi:hypothetical protein